MELSSLFDQGVSKVKSTVSSVSVEQRPFVKAFVRMCADGWEQGWHERNGGNASYRLTPEEVTACRPYFYVDEHPWAPIGVQSGMLGGEFFLVTGTGSFMRNIPLDPVGNIGIVEIDPAGASYRVVWGLGEAGRPTSEFAAHFMMHAVKKARGSAARVLYHCHPASVIALGNAVAPTSRETTRALWKTMTECIMVFPEGVGAVGVMTPGGRELACATAHEMESHDAVVWAHHGLMVAGATFDAAFGLAHVIVKAAQIYRDSCAMCVGGAFPFEVTDDELRRIAGELEVSPNPEYL